MLTPLHIVPEWFFLRHYYAMLKAVPIKMDSLSDLLPSLSYFKRSCHSIYIYGHPEGLMVLPVLLVSFTSSFIWIGGQIPVDSLLSDGRILTIHYYLLIFWRLLIQRVKKTMNRSQ